MTDLVEKAQATVAELLRKRDKAVEYWENMTAERSAISYAALAEGDKDAKKRLDQINSDGAKINTELESIDAAIREAKERVAAAEADERAAEAQESAHALRDQYQRFIKLADVADEHLRSFVVAAGELKTTMDAIHGIQSGAAPTGQQLLVFGEMAVRAAVLQTMWSRSVEFLPPNQRHSLPKLARGWAEPALRAIEAALGEAKEAAA